MDLNSETSSKVKRMMQIIIQPETKLERNIVSKKDFVTGVMWGKPRQGHPEGKVLFHIGHVLKNIDLYSNSENRLKLRLIALIHDTFKYKVDIKTPKDKENNHAVFCPINLQKNILLIRMCLKLFYFMMKHIILGVKVIMLEIGKQPNKEQFNLLQNYLLQLIFIYYFINVITKQEIKMPSVSLGF
ncbi:MAG: hypothetical protein IPM95_13695 [Sphingobacteriales bacterium]|nr:hypothetical protein [Sphingobacteriales bacterium]